MIVIYFWMLYTNFTQFVDSHITPKHSMIKEGEHQMIVCDSLIPPQWTFRNQLSPRNAIQNQFNYTLFTLTIPLIEKWQSGQYICHGRDPQTYTEFQEWIWVHVYADTGK